MAVTKVLNTTSFTIEVEKNVFRTDGGSLTAKYSAQLTERAVTKSTV